MQAARKHQIRHLLCRHGLCSVADLASQLSASEATIRRDLAELAEAGEVVRVRGGAMLPRVSADADTILPFESVAARDCPAKDQIARAAADMVADGETVIIDIGTTTTLLARRLRGRPVTIITTSLSVLDEVRNDPVVEVIVVGGNLRRTYHSLVGVVTHDALAQLSAQKCFLGTSGITADMALCDTSMIEVPVKRAMLAASTQSIVLADHDKFPGEGTYRVCPLSDVDTVVTDEATPADVVAAIDELEVTVEIA